MAKKPDTSTTIFHDDVPAILRVHEEKKDPNSQDVPKRDLSNYLRERYWINQWTPSRRWKNRSPISFGGQTDLRIVDLERKLDDPGDAFHELLLHTSKSIIHFRTWTEVTEVFLNNEQAEKVKVFIRDYNRLQGKGKLDIIDFLKSHKLNPPDSRMQREMADRVISNIKKKAIKGDNGSYKSLVQDYGRGLLIVGLPLWYATLPSDLTNPSIVLTDFAPRLLYGLNEMRHSVLRKCWCPFDSVVILWNPTLKAFDEWIKVADPESYLNPENYSLRYPLPFGTTYSYLKKLDQHKLGTTFMNVHWNRYPSINAMLADQRKWFRSQNNPRPLGPKSYLTIKDHKSRSSFRRLYFYGKIIELWMFVKLHGLHGLRRWFISGFSIRRLYSRWRFSHQARKMYQESLSKQNR